MKSLLRQISQESDAIRISLETNIEEPTLGTNDVKIEVKACGISFVNSKVLEELYKKNPKQYYPVGLEVSGIVTEIGSNVTGFNPTDRVTGILAADSSVSGCSEFCVLPEYDIVSLPESVSFTDVAACLGDGVKAYTALHYQARICSGDTVLIMDGATSFGSMAVQLALNMGAKVLTTASNPDEKSYLLSHHPNVAEVIDLGEKSNDVLGRVMEETGGLGVDCVVDSGVKLFTSQEDMHILVDNLRHPLPSKHEIIQCLAVGGRWVTTQQDLQLDPPNSQTLFLKCASVCFLFEHMWLLSMSQQGRFLHILKDIVNKIDKGAIRPNIQKKVNFDNAQEVLKSADFKGVGKIVFTP